MDRRIAESQESLADANMGVKLASNKYEEIHNATNHDQLARLQATENNPMRNIQVSSVLFSTTVI